VKLEGPDRFGRGRNRVEIGQIALNGVARGQFDRKHFLRWQETRESENVAPFATNAFIVSNPISSSHPVTKSIFW